MDAKSAVSWQKKNKTALANNALTMQQQFKLNAILKQSCQRSRGMPAKRMEIRCWGGAGWVLYSRGSQSPAPRGPLRMCGPCAAAAKVGGDTSATLLRLGLEAVVVCISA